MNLINKYFLNYLVWWYVIQARVVLGKLLGGWVFLLGVLNVSPMLKNLFQPLYQDYSKMGRLIAFPIRLTWVLFGAGVGFILLPIILISVAIYLFLPLMPVYGIVVYFTTS